MAELWDAFLEDYANEVHNWSLRFTLEIFWHYCQDGNKAVAIFLEKEIITGIVDKSGEPRSKTDFLEALQALTKFTVSRDMLQFPYFSVFIGVINDALKECLNRRQ